MLLIDRFHLMEQNYKLFDASAEVPYWDIIRYTTFLKYNYLEEFERTTPIVPHTFKHYVLLIKEFFRFLWMILFVRKNNVFLSTARYKVNGSYIDKSSYSIINQTNNDYITLESNFLNKPYKWNYDFCYVFRKIYHNKSTYPRFVYDQISKALIETFGESKISYNEVVNLYDMYCSDLAYYGFVLKKIKAKRLFITAGNQKATVQIAARLHIQSFLLQHSGIEIDEIDYSYPLTVTPNSNIAYAEYLLTFGRNWCKNINVPVRKIIPIGNYFFSKKVEPCDDGFLLVISSIVHGNSLKHLSKELATLSSNNIVFKLHPNERLGINNYLEYFDCCKNIRIIYDEVDTSELIAKSKGVVLIVSGAVYEAMDQNKNVFIYKRLNYERQYALKQYPNLFFIDNANQILENMDRIPTEYSHKYYDVFDEVVIAKILSE